jgi:hypothetical protein
MDRELERRKFVAARDAMPSRALRLVGKPPLRVGDDVYKLFHLSDRDGRKLELRVSRDGCRTWKRALR